MIPWSPTKTSSSPESRSQIGKTDFNILRGVGKVIGISQEEAGKTMIVGSKRDQHTG